MYQDNKEISLSSAESKNHKVFNWIFCTFYCDCKFV